MPIVRASDITEFDRGGSRSAGLAAPSKGAREVMVWRTRCAPGGGPPPHRHDHEEVCVILAGSGELREEGGEYERFETGDVVIASAGTVHEVRADAETGCEWIAALPAGTRTWRADGTELQIPWAE
jgi:quercetin dioxygenase-like cupin family protein